MERSSFEALSLGATVLLSTGQEWGFTLAFFLLFVAVAYFYIKLVNGDLAEWTLPMWRSPKSSQYDDKAGPDIARPLLSDDTYDDNEVVEL